MKFSIRDFFSKCEQIRRKLRIWSDLLKKSLMENFIFGPVKSGRHSKQITDFTTQGDMGISNSQRDHDYYQIPARIHKQGSWFSVKISQGFNWVEIEFRDLSNDIQAKVNTRFRSIWISSFTAVSSLHELEIGFNLQGKGCLSKFMDSHEKVCLFSIFTSGSCSQQSTETLGKKHHLIENGNLQLLAWIISGKSYLQKEFQRKLP